MKTPRTEGTVTLTLEEFNKLRDFKNEVLNDKTPVVINRSYEKFHTCTTVFYTEQEVKTAFDERVKALEEELSKLKPIVIEVEDLKRCLQNKSNESSGYLSILKSIQKMSILRFLSWRKRSPFS